MAVVHDRVITFYVEFGLAAVLMAAILYFLLTMFRRNHDQQPPSGPSRW
jgi:hypothetical protein